MNWIEALLLDLKSSDPSVRDKAAIELMDLGNAAAIHPLLEAIARPGNANYRGTLVYALSRFDCLEHVEFLVDLAVTGNYEVSCGAFNIIDGTELTLVAIEKMKGQLRKYDRDQLSFEHQMAYDALVQVTSGPRA